MDQAKYQNTENYRADSFLVFGLRLAWSPDSEEELNHYFQQRQWFYWEKPLVDFYSVRSPAGA